ncbi:hypothetical protein L0F63_003786 [Massospora cicadina]|nr:hypothetical protein L0F63_003786 [Massospora cicadina]
MLSQLKVLLANCLIAAILADPHDVRGVPKDQLKLYKPLPGNKFSCFNDPGTQYDFSVVNDDYCDCKDGSDEPGTSACPNMTYTCRNDGFIPAKILSSRVNDGVCDPECCDGSDEYNNRIVCPDVCAKIAKETKDNLEATKKMIEKCLKIKEGYIKKYDTFKKATKSNIERLQTLITETKVKVDNLRKIKEEKEKEEKVPDPKVEAEMSRTKAFEDKIEDLKEVVSGLQNDIRHLQSILDELKLNHNQNYHDLAVKGAITAYDEFVENYSEIDIEADPKFAYDKTQDAFELTTSEDANQARNQFYDAETELRNLERDLEKAQKKLETDFGPRGEYVALDEKCIDFVESEYTYSLCLFGDVYQKPLDGSKTHLGRFEKWDGSDYKVQMYTGGASCWHGPERLTKVYIECGPEEKILEVSEPAKCEYQMRITTPAACQPLKEAPVDDEQDEL